MYKVIHTLREAVGFRRKRWHVMRRSYHNVAYTKGMGLPSCDVVDDREGELDIEALPHVET